MSEGTRRLKVVQVITHFAVGGATETVLTACREADHEAFDMMILCGKTVSGEQSLLQEATDSGIPVYEMSSLRRAIAPAWEGKAFQNLVQWFQNNPCDIVHTHGSKAGIIARLAAAKAGVPGIVHTVHGWGHHAHQHPLLRLVYVAAERRAAQVTDKIIVVADANREKGLADKIGTSGQYETIHSCINIAAYRDVCIDKAALRAGLGIPSDAPVVGTVGRFAPQKAPDDFVRMAGAIHALRPDAHFVYVGNGPLQEQTEAQVCKAGLESVFHLPGYREDIPALLRVFDVFTLTSLWEGLPRVFAQAMCAGLPIVATQVDGAAEAIREGENGFLIPPRRPLEQAERVLELLNDPIRRIAMGKRGLELVYPQFCEQEMVRRIENIYRCVASKSPVKRKRKL